MLGTILGAGLQLAGGLMNRSAQKDANKAAQRQADQNIALQKEFAQKGIQWRTADAHAAGIHPAFALGSPPIQFNPVVTGHRAADGLGNALAGMGQDISRSQMAVAGRGGRANIVNQKLTQLGLERAGLQNQLLRAQIANTVSRTAQSQIGPPGVEELPLERTISGKAPHQTAGTVGGKTYSQEFPGGYVPLPTPHNKQLMEDTPLSWLWTLKHAIGPNFGWNFDPPKNIPLKPGNRWTWSPSKQAYVQRKKPDWSRMWKGYSSPYPK